MMKEQNSAAAFPTKCKEWAAQGTHVAKLFSVIILL